MVTISPAERESQPMDTRRLLDVGGCRNLATAESFAIEWNCYLHGRSEKTDLNLENRSSVGSSIGTYTP